LTIRSLSQRLVLPGSNHKYSKKKYARENVGGGLIRISHKRFEEIGRMG
jgi:hypothetical protein